MTEAAWKTHHALTADFPPRSFGRRGSRSQRAALVLGEQTLTWQQLDDRVAKTITVLRDLGVGVGDHIGLLLDNSFEYFEVAYAAAALEAAIVPIPPKSSVRELRTAFSVTDCLLVIAQTGAVLATATEAARDTEVEVVALDGGPDSFTERRDAAEPDHGTYAHDESATFYLALTGGTTGFPKACAITHRVQVQWWRLTALEFDLKERDVHLAMAPLHHGLEFFFAFAQLGVGGTVVILPTFDAHAAMEVMSARPIDSIAGVPTMYRTLLREGWSTESAPRTLISGGAALTPELREALAAAVPDTGIYDYYGASDGGIFAIRKPEDHDLPPSSLGYPPAGIELLILDENGAEVPRGQHGRVYKRGLGLGAEYYRRPRETRAGYRGDWHTVGDLGYLDEGGSLYVLGRANDTIITGGVNVFPDRIESVLRRHPGVIEAAVVGVADDTWGHAVHAVVVLEATASRADLDAYLAEHLSRYERPKVVHLWDQLPRSAAGKVLRREVLRELEAGGKE